MPGFILFPSLKTLSSETFSLFQQFTLFPSYLLSYSTRHLQLSDSLHQKFSAPLLLTHLASWHFLANLPSLFLDLAALSNSAPPAKSATSQCFLNTTYPCATPPGTPLCSENSTFIPALCFLSPVIKPWQYLPSHPAAAPSFQSLLKPQLDYNEKKNQPCLH